MAFGFDKNSTQTTVTISQLRNVVTDRLQAAQGRAGLTDSFNGAADNMVGSLLFSLLTWTPIMAGLESAIEGAFGPSDAFNALSSPALAAAADGVSMLADEKATKNRIVKVGAYHGGRRQDPIMAPKKMNGKFNMVAANENNRFAYDALAEVAAMNEMLDMLDSLEKAGVSMLRLDEGKPVYESLKALTAKPKAGMTRTAAPLRMAA